MLEKISRNWWLYAVRGVVAIIFGVVAFARPEQALQALVLVFGAYALVDGIFAVIAGIAARGYFNRWWAVLLEGVAGVIIGLLTFFWPNITALALLYFIAAWALITGIFEIVAAIQFRYVITGEWMLILGGLLSILFGILLFVFPVAGAVSVIWVIGIYAVVFGISEIIFAFRLRGLRRELESAGA
ncbi:MAG: HdeD family acid-resistance protein [Anaerolineales bacterium]|nr:HdeD family acid-resistance protein [Anaerolineales bacterium]